jgi:hypothetical protein
LKAQPMSVTEIAPMMPRKKYCHSLLLRIRLAQ